MTETSQIFSFLFYSHNYIYEMPLCVDFIVLVSVESLINVTISCSKVTDRNDTTSHEQLNYCESVMRETIWCVLYLYLSSLLHYFAKQLVTITLLNRTDTLVSVSTEPLHYDVKAIY